MIRKPIIRILGFILLGFSVYSCGTLPRKPDDKSIVVIGIKNNKADFEKYYVYFRLFYTNNDYIRIDPTKDRCVSMNFEPGEYAIIAIQPVYYHLNQSFKKTETSISFSCFPNEITILMDALKVSFEAGEDGYITEHAEFTTLSGNEYEDLVGKIKSDINAKYWRIFSN
jgi:hypothetical protein